MVQPKCKCNHEFENLNLGGGFSEFRTSCLVPSPCFNCKNVFGLNIFNKKHLCPTCRRKSTPYGEISTNPSPNPSHMTGRSRNTTSLRDTHGHRELHTIFQENF